MVKKKGIKQFGNEIIMDFLRDGLSRGEKKIIDFRERKNRQYKSEIRII